MSHILEKAILLPVSCSHLTVLLQKHCTSLFQLCYTAEGKLRKCSSLGINYWDFKNRLKKEIETTSLRIAKLGGRQRHSSSEARVYWRKKSVGREQNTSQNRNCSGKLPLCGRKKFSTFSVHQPLYMNIYINIYTHTARSCSHSVTSLLLHLPCEGRGRTTVQGQAQAEPPGGSAGVRERTYCPGSGG